MPPFPSRAGHVTPVLGRDRGGSLLDAAPETNALLPAFRLSADDQRRFRAHMNEDDDLYRELAQCQERLLQIEHEIELLTWLPTSYGWSLFARLSREHARLDWLCRLLGRQQSDARASQD